jgi:hypothetical protein
MSDEIDKIHELAALAIQQFQSLVSFPFGYTAESVEWVDGFIERNRLSQSAEQQEGLVNVIGSYLGEAIIANYGGAWARDNVFETWGVCLGGENWAFPFAKVQKQYENGSGDSIYSFFQIVPHVFKNPAEITNKPKSLPEIEKKPWWKFGQ